MADEIATTSHQQQDSLQSTLNNNSDNRSRESTGGAQKKVPITELFETGARCLGLLILGWAVLVLVQDGIVLTLVTKDCIVALVIFFLTYFRYWRLYCPQATRSTGATLSLPTHNIQEPRLTTHFIISLIYCCELVSAMTSGALSITRLISHDFGQTEMAKKAPWELEMANMSPRDILLIGFYGIVLGEALMSLVLKYAVLIVFYFYVIALAKFIWKMAATALKFVWKMAATALKFVWKMPATALKFVWKMPATAPVPPPAPAPGPQPSPAPELQPAPASEPQPAARRRIRNIGDDDDETDLRISEEIIS